MKWKSNVSSLIFTLLMAAGLFVAPVAEAQIVTEGNHTLITEPDDQTGFIVQQIGQAKESIYITIYQFDSSNQALYNAIVSAAQRNVKVYITYNYFSFGNGYGQNPTPEQQQTTSFMQNLTKLYPNIQTHPASDVFLVTHQKGIVIDESAAFICSFNFINNYFGGTRDFGIYTTNPSEVQEMLNVAKFDFSDNCKEQTPAGTVYPGSQINTPGMLGLIWSNSYEGTSRDREKALILSARSSIYMYQELVQDPEMLELIGDIANKYPKMDVRIIAPQLGTPDGNAAGIQQLKNHKVKTLEVLSSEKTKLYNHAKMILVDANPSLNLPTAAAYIGSVNFSKASLDDNREAGIIFNERALLTSLYNTFMADWAIGGGNIPSWFNPSN